MYVLVLVLGSVWWILRQSLYPTKLFLYPRDLKRINDSTSTTPYILYLLQENHRKQQGLQLWQGLKYKSVDVKGSFQISKSGISLEFSRLALSHPPTLQI